MNFIESYKYLDKLCGETMGEKQGVSAYIDTMLNIPNGANWVVNWSDDLKQLKHYRWVRNKIAHEVGYTEENMCEPGDVEWINHFYQRILNQTDPLALYRKALQQHRKPQPQQRQMKDEQSSMRINLVDVLIWGLISVAAILLVVFLISL